MLLRCVIAFALGSIHISEAPRFSKCTVKMLNLTSAYSGAIHTKIKNAISTATNCANQITQKKYRIIFFGGGALHDCRTAPLLGAIEMNGTWTRWCSTLTAHFEIVGRITALPSADVWTEPQDHQWSLKCILLGLWKLVRVLLWTHKRVSGQRCIYQVCHNMILCVHELLV